ncbi:hypothetical protein [Actinocrispum sp. NPDC049592]|uniref:hypothetical protein n=1 Tax=Actinocrispum sp. NPDC049592 TaxID=3154835 RepID=UPI003422FF2B
MKISNVVVRVLTAGVAVGAVAAGPVMLAGNASAGEVEKGGSICGTVWTDTNGDGLRQADEKPIPFHLVRVDGRPRFALSDLNGHYCLKNLPEGGYVLKSGDRARIDQTGWTLEHPTGGGSRFDNTTGLGYDYKDMNRIPVQITKQDGKFTHVENFDSGFVPAKVDLRTVQVLVDPMSPPGKVFKVGDVIEVYGSVSNSGNVAEHLGGTLTLPEGVTILETRGGTPSHIKGQQVIGDFTERRFPGDGEFVGALVRINRPMTDAEVKIEVHKGVYKDIDPTNNVLTGKLTAVA